MEQCDSGKRGQTMDQLDDVSEFSGRNPVGVGKGVTRGACIASLRTWLEAGEPTYTRGV
jgi:hypothetical protein